MRTPETDLTLVIPLYRSADSVADLVRRLSLLQPAGSWEVVFVDDGSPDDTVERLRRELERRPLPCLRVVLVHHSRNFGEHQAVLSGYRQAHGRHIVNLDDDLQNPPEEALRLWQHGCARGLDVTYGAYRQKRHAGWRNLGSSFANRTAGWLLDLPERFYLSSFRCVEGGIARQAAAYRGPYPYIDGLLSQLTQSIGSLDVHHDGRAAGESGYNMRRLIRLWLTIFTSFSLMPLRLASLLGGVLALGGFGILVGLLLHSLLHGVQVQGWLSIISAIMLFGGMQCLLIGVLGEYLGRIFLTVSGKPQSFIRAIEGFPTLSVESMQDAHGTASLSTP